MEPIRILQVVTIMNMGGVETFLMTMYRNIDRSKVQFDFLVHRQERGVFDDEIESLGGKIFRLVPISIRNFFKYQSQLNTFLKEHREYQTIHSHLNSNSYFILKAAEKLRVNVRIAHSHINSAVGTNKYYKIVLKQNLPRYATDFFACSKDAGNWLFGDNNLHRVKIINNAVDTELFKFDSLCRAKQRSNLQVDDKVIYGHVGRFNVQKNHRFLLALFKKIVDEKPNSLLLLIGEGELENEIRSLVIKLNLQEHVKFLGAIKNVNEVMQVMDCFIFPSIFEGLGIVVIEAQTAGLVTIVSDSVPNEVMITPSIVKVSLKKSEKEWADIILSQNLSEHKSANRELVIQAGYDIKNNVAELQKFYLESYER